MKKIYKNINKMSQVEEAINMSKKGIVEYVINNKLNNKNLKINAIDYQDVILDQFGDKNWNFILIFKFGDYYFNIETSSNQDNHYAHLWVYKFENEERINIIRRCKWYGDYSDEIVESTYESNELEFHYEDCYKCIDIQNDIIIPEIYDILNAVENIFSHVEILK